MNTNPNSNEPAQAPYRQTHSHLGIALIILGVLMILWYTYRWIQTGGPFLPILLNGLWWVVLGNVLNWLFRIHQSLKKLTGEKDEDEEDEFKEHEHPEP